MSDFSFPHVRGGVPQEGLGELAKFEFSPRAWGCTEERLLWEYLSQVFPTCVGVYRTG